ncbi:MAG: hypothetical protein SGJ07_08290 [Rhodospirillaceae bacterium]|nr:hypothetical protein [Rhodospirillaceae bacterium]
MADHREPERGSNNALYFIVGGLVVIVAVLAYLFLGGDGPEMADDADVTIEVPAADSDADTDTTTTTTE